uniref:Late embryogenesis abundant protein LEA-2 subgroup domain-containing protein n=2 Tax=Physcomitrium patens TaxID=3218 RepID=A0A7I4F593_PHYPA
MAFKAVFLLVALLAAVSAVAEAHEEKSDRFSLKIILHNTASRDVSFKLVNLGKHAYDTVVGKGDQWSAIGPVIVNLKFPVMRLAVSVTNKSYVLRKKLLKIDLERRFGRDYLKGKKFIVLTAQESWKKEFLFIKLGRTLRLQQACDRVSPLLKYREFSGRKCMADNARPNQHKFLDDKPSRVCGDMSTWITIAVIERIHNDIKNI